MNVGTVTTPNAGAVALSSDGIEREITFESQVAWGDVIENRSATPLEIKLPALEAGQGANLLVIQPGASARLERLGDDAVGTPNRTNVVAQTEGVELFDISDDINTAVLEQEDDGAAAMGLVGAGVLGGSGLAAAALGAAGVGALALSDGDDDSQGSDGSIQTASDRSGGVAGGVQGVAASIEETPLEPAASPVREIAAAVVTVGDALSDASEQDPTGVANLLAETVGNSDSPSSQDNGVVGVVSSAASGLEQGSEGSPLEGLVAPLATTLGSDDGQTTGVAQGLGAVGTTLAKDDSALAPLTSEILAPIVGDAGGGESGLSNTVFDVGDGIEALTAEDSAVAPLAPVTGGLVTGTDTLAAGLDEAGDAIYEAGEQDPSGVAKLVGDLLGGDATGTEPPVSADQPEAPDAGTTGTPLDIILDPIAGAAGAGMEDDANGDTSSVNEAGGVAGGLDALNDGLEQTALAPLVGVTAAVADLVFTLGDGIDSASESDPSGLTDILSSTLGDSDTTGPKEDGVVGLLNAVGTGLDEGATGSPLEQLIDPVSELVGSQEGASSGIASGVGAIGTTLALDESPLSPLTADLLSPIVSEADGVDSGLPSTLDEVANGLTELTSDSALEPLAPVTEGASGVVMTIAEGCRGIGRQVRDFAGDQDNSGVSDLVADLLGGGRGQGRGIRTQEDSDVGLGDVSAQL